MAPIRTVLVSPVPGNPVASGTALRNALAGIPSPTATNPWLLQIEPGIYDIGAIPLAMRAWVDIEGSGIGVTTIRGSVDPGPDPLKGTVTGASNAELRLVTVQAEGSAAVPGVIAMVNTKASPRLYRVKLVAQASSFVAGMRNVQSAPILEECEISSSATSSASSQAYGITFRAEVVGQRSSILRSKITVANATQNHGVHFVFAQTLTEIQDSRINVTGGQKTYGLFAQGDNWVSQEVLTLRNVVLSSKGGSVASYGVRFEQGSSIGLDIFNSSLAGQDSPTTFGIAQHAPAPVALQGSKVSGLTKTIESTVGNVWISSTYLQGGPVTVGGTLKCMALWDENGVFFPNSSPP